ALNLTLARLGRLAMERAARNLGPLRDPTEDAPEIFYLSGHRFVYQTVFCAVSLSRQARRTFRFVAIDDGTLGDNDIRLLQRVHPRIRIVRAQEVEATLDRRLPSAQYPELRRRRLAYPQLRKLTAVHAGAGGWKLVLDSDMLFHGRPTFILNW